MNTTLESDVALAMRGDADAYQRVVAQSANTVCSIALAIVRNVSASEDVAQEVFLAVWTSLRKLRNPASFLPWLRQVTRNQAHLWLREHARELGDEDALAAAIDSRPDSQRLLLDAEERRVLQEVLATLPDDAREVLILYYREGSSARHVANLLGISVEAVKQRLSRARAKVREDVLQRFSIAVTRTTPMIVLPDLAATSALPLTGVLPAIAGVLIGMKKLEPFLDAREERELRTLRDQAVVAVIAGSVLIAFGFHLDPEPPRFAILVPIALLVAAIGWLHGVRLPRILARRLESERRELVLAAIARTTAAICGGLGITFQLLRWLR